MVEEQPHGPFAGEIAPSEEVPEFSVQKVFVAGNIGMCVGVRNSLRMAHEVTDITKEHEDVYAPHELVHNVVAMDKLSKKRLKIQPDLLQIPIGSKVIFPAHGTSPDDYKTAQERNFTVFDTVCPIVTGVRERVKNAIKKGGYQVVYVGVEGHRETEGMMGEDPHNITLVQTVEDVEELSFDDEQPLIAYSQTTLSGLELADVMKKLRKKFPSMKIPPKRDICFAAESRQLAVIGMLDISDLLLIVGSKTSHNSQVMRQLGEMRRIPSYSIDYPHQINPSWFSKDIRFVAFSAGASAEDDTVNANLKWLTDRGAEAEFLEPIVKEPNVTIKFPEERIEALRAEYNNMPHHLNLFIED